VPSAEDAANAPRPFQIDRCHALRSEGEVVRLYYPRWHRQANTPSTAANSGPTHLSGT
jgi:hypothetical protein